MVLDNRELVQNERVGRVLGRELGEEEVGGWVLERVWFGACSAFIGFGGAGWFLCEGWTVAKLELGGISMSICERMGLGMFSEGVTGIPEEWIMERWVAENVRWPASLAVAKRRDTNVDRLSERPNCMLDLYEETMNWRWNERRQSGDYENTDHVTSIQGTKIC